MQAEAKTLHRAEKKLQNVAQANLKLGPNGGGVAHIAFMTNVVSPMRYGRLSKQT